MRYIYRRDNPFEGLLKTAIYFLFCFILSQRCFAFQYEFISAKKPKSDAFFSSRKFQTSFGDTVVVQTESRGSLLWSNMFVNIPRDWVRWSQISFRHDKIGMWVAVTSSTALLIATDAKTYEPSKKFYDSDPARAFYNRLFAEL